MCFLIPGYAIEIKSSALVRSGFATIVMRLGFHKLISSPSDPTIIGAGAVLAFLICTALFGPLFTGDPLAFDPMNRLKAPSGAFWCGTDFLGRDVFARMVHGARISLSIGFGVAFLAIVCGLLLGLTAGYIRWLDAVIMRIMDGLMAIPGLLFAIALVSLSGAGLPTVIVAILIPEIPRVARLARAATLSLREEPYVEAAIAAGTRPARLIMRHILPGAATVLAVQGTYICGSAMLNESILGFLGAGLPPEMPSWGAIMADGRTYFQLTPWIIFYPGAALAACVLAVNILGDGLRDRFDPQFSGISRP